MSKVKHPVMPLRRLSESRVGSFVRSVLGGGKMSLPESDRPNAFMRKDRLPTPRSKDELVQWLDQIRHACLTQFDLAHGRYTANNLFLGSVNKAARIPSADPIKRLSGVSRDARIVFAHSVTLKAASSFCSGAEIRCNSEPPVTIVFLWAADFFSGAPKNRDEDSRLRVTVAASWIERNLLCRTASKLGAVRKRDWMTIHQKSRKGQQSPLYAWPVPLGESRTGGAIEVGPAPPLGATFVPLEVLQPVSAFFSASFTLQGVFERKWYVIGPGRAVVIEHDELVAKRTARRVAKR